MVKVKYPDNWEQLQAEAIRAAGYRCQRCGRGGNLQVHHKVPLSQGGDSRLSNLRVLCFYCHSGKHPHLERRLGKKKLYKGRKYPKF